MILIGSQAAKLWGIERSVPKDLDFFQWEKRDFLPNNTNLKTESHLIPVNLYDHLLGFTEMFKVKGTVLTPDALFTLKCSHLQWDIKWEKTKQDILWFSQKHQCKIIPELYEKLVEYWTTIHGNKDFLSLEKSSEEFFNDKVYYKYEHDSLHEMVADPNRPVYEKCLKDGEEVAIDKDKFDLLSFEQQIKMFREEIHVIALERYILNEYNDVDEYIPAYNLALKKTITALTKGWSSTFIIQHLVEFIKPDIQLMKRIKGDEMSFKNLPENLKNFIEHASKGNEADKSKDVIVYYLCEGSYFDYIPENMIEEFEQHYVHIEQEGGGEGGAENCYGVFKWDGKYYKAWYSYRSYEGHNFNDISENIKEVKPIQKMITIYK